MSARMADLETRMRLTCFKAYALRAKLGADLNEDIAYRVGRSVAETLEASRVVIGFDARETSPTLAEAAACGVRAAGADVLDIGLWALRDVLGGYVTKGLRGD